MSDRIGLVALATLAVLGCGRDGRATPADKDGASADRTARTAADGPRDPHDPCRLVSRSEAEALIGPLRHDPYRVDDESRVRANGSGCFYQAVDGRNVRIDVTFDGGRTAMGLIGMVAQPIDQVFRLDGSSVDTAAVDWDEARWQWPGGLKVLKGDVLLDIDVGGSRVGVDGAIRLAAIAVGRLASPLDYDSRRATARAPEPLVPTGDPCGLITRAEIEQTVGPLAEEPVPSADRSACEYRLTSRRLAGPDHFTVTVQWRDGFKAFSNAKAVIGAMRSGSQLDRMRMARTAVGGKSDGSDSVRVDTVSADGHARRGDPDFDKLMGGITGVLGKIGPTPAFSKSGLGLETDTLVAGPWDEAAILMGSAFHAVKRDAMVSVEIGAVTYEQARKLAAAALARLPGGG